MTAFAIVGWTMLGGFITGLFVELPSWWDTGSPEPPEWWMVECD